MRIIYETDDGTQFDNLRAAINYNNQSNIQINKEEVLEESNLVNEYLKNYKEQKLAEFCVQKDKKIKNYEKEKQKFIKQISDMKDKVQEHDEKVIENKKITFIAQFENYYDLKQENIILNSIRVTMNTLEYNIPFDILIAGENVFRIIPSVAGEKFFVKYEYIGKEEVFEVKAANLI